MISMLLFFPFDYNIMSAGLSFVRSSVVVREIKGKQKHYYYYDDIRSNDRKWESNASKLVGAGAGSV